MIQPTKTARHTPGPWRTVDGDHSAVVAIKVPGRGRPEQLVARIYGESNDAFEANCSLVAAAPELLEACKDAASWFKAAGMSTRGPLRDLYDKLQAVINRAERRAV